MCVHIYIHLLNCAFTNHDVDIYSYRTFIDLMTIKLKSYKPAHYTNRLLITEAAPEHVEEKPLSM